MKSKEHASDLESDADALPDLVFNEEGELVSTNQAAEEDADE